jgi:hypothetical protein
MSQEKAGKRLLKKLQYRQKRQKRVIEEAAPPV